MTCASAAEGTRRGDSDRDREVDVHRHTLQALMQELPLPHHYCAVALHSHSVQVPACASPLEAALHDYMKTGGRARSSSWGGETCTPEQLPTRPCRYSSLLQQAWGEAAAWAESGLSRDSQAGWELSANALVRQVNRAYVTDLRATWISLALLVSAPPLPCGPAALTRNAAD